jgi:hypothetical protein
VNRPTYAWHELLRPLNDHAPAKQEVYDRGKEVHRIVRAIIGEHWVGPRPRTIDETENGTGLLYSDFELPFDIVYHPDITRQDVSIEGVVQTHVYDVKSFSDYLQHRVYCEAQISGYAHFLGAATAELILYWRADASSPDRFALSLCTPKRIPWEQLKKVAMTSFMQMQMTP